MPTIVRSHAKINLGLGIGAPRPDGFHSLATVYQTLELHDLVTVTAVRASATAIRLTSNDTRVPDDGRNTAWKMVERALEDLRLVEVIVVEGILADELGGRATLALRSVFWPTASNPHDA